MPGQGNLHENTIAKEIVDAAYKIHTKLGPGLLESVYKVILAHELRKRGLQIQRQLPVPIIWEDIQFQEGYRFDLMVETKCSLKSNLLQVSNLFTRNNCLLICA